MREKYMVVYNVLMSTRHFLLRAYIENVFVFTETSLVLLLKKVESRKAVLHVGIILLHVDMNN